MPFKSYVQTYTEIHGEPPPSLINIAESSADILSESRGFMGGFDFTLQIQVGCPGGCLFCYVPSGPRLTPAAVRGPGGRSWGYEIRNKQNAAKRLSRHLESGRLADKTIYWSGITDPYAAPPGVTEEMWRVLGRSPAPERPRRIAVQSRFPIDRDVSLISEYDRSTVVSDGGPAVVVSYSLGTDRSDLIQAWEKATPSFERRIQTIQALREAGLFVVVTLSPFGLWNDLRGTMTRLKEWGVGYITILFFKEHTKSANTPARFLQYLRSDYPVLLDPAWQAERIQDVEQIFGKGRVLVGQAGFTSLANPQQVLQDVSLETSTGS